MLKLLIVCCGNECCQDNFTVVDHNDLEIKLLRFGNGFMLLGMYSIDFSCFIFQQNVAFSSNKMTNVFIVLKIAL